jgi:hypothetical protein
MGDQPCRTRNLPSPAEAVFVAMQSFRELDDHPDVKQEPLNRIIQQGIDAVEESGGILAGED